MITIKHFECEKTEEKNKKNQHFFYSRKTNIFFSIHFERQKTIRTFCTDTHTVSHDISCGPERSRESRKNV